MNVEGKDKAPPNFSRWMLGIISGTSFVIGPIIVGLGYEAGSFGMDVIIADRALMAMGVITCILSIVSIIGTLRSDPKLLLFSFYSLVVLVIFISVFSLGTWLMLGDIQEYIDRNWETIREIVPEYSMVGFKSHVESEIQSLVSFSFTGILLNTLSIVTISILISKNVKKTLLPVTSLILSVLGSALIAVSIYSRRHSNFTQLPLWTNYVFTLIGFIVMGLGIFGYYSVIHSRKDNIKIYAFILGLTSVFLVIAGIGFIELSSYVAKHISDNWEKINADLELAGYEVDINELIQIINTNFKFAGLFGVVNFLFFLLSFLGSVLYMNLLSKNESKLNPMGYR